MAFLQYTPPGHREEQSHPISEQDVTIGRADGNTIMLRDEAISRQHAVISTTPGGHRLVDQGSANGTFVNNQPVSDHLLQEGDRIRIGKTVLLYSERPDPNATVAIDTEAYAERIAEEELKIRAGATPQAPPPVPASPPPAATAAAPDPPPRPASPPPVAVAPPPPQPAASAMAGPPPVAGAARTGEPAGFGIRLLAYLIDSLLLGLAVAVILVPTGLLTTMLAQRSSGLATLVMLLGGLLATAVSLLYLLYFWATRGATPGKTWLGLKIVREDGIEPMGWAKAGLRLLGYLASGAIFCIGFLMVAFTERHRGLHDMIAGTLVVRTK